jgi:hypothetical protein
MPAALLACDVFTDELAALRREFAASALGPARFLEMGLHDHPARLRARLQTEIDRLYADPDVERILLAYGRCGDGLVGVRAMGVPLHLPRGHDCISILLGDSARHEAVLREHPATYFYSPGWIRGRRVPGPDRPSHLRALYTERHPDDPELVEDLLAADAELFARHDRAAYVDLTQDRAAEDYCRACAKHLGWSFVRLAGDPALLRALLTGPRPEDKFLTVPPGHVIARAPSGALVATAR